MTSNWELFNIALRFHVVQSVEHPELIQSIGEDEKDFTRNLYLAFQKAKVFEINEDVKEMLIKTDGTKDLDKLPFDIMFLDIRFDLSKFNDKQFGHDIKESVGILIAKTNAVIVTREEKFRKVEGIDAVRIYILCLDSKGGYSFNTINVVDKDNIFGKKMEYKSEQPHIRNFILNFVSNALNLINHNKNDIQIIIKNYSEAKNKRRIRQGLPPIPKKRIIIPVGELKRYIYLMKQDSGFHYSHKFWVRGHWRVLRDEKRFKERAGTKMWIKPFVKGKGILIDKTYEVKE